MNEDSTQTTDLDAHCVELLDKAGTLARAGDEVGLLAYLRRSWSPSSLVAILNGESSEAAQLAAHCLGVMAGPATILPLVGALQHDDPMIASAAEDALWRVGMSAAGRMVRQRLIEAMELMGEGRHAAAGALLDDIIERDGDFAEAYHQRAICRCLQEDFARAITDGQRAVRLNGWHFGAHATVGSAYAEVGEMEKALDSYQSALKIHPRMDGIRQSMRKIRSGRNHTGSVTI
jgi:tetratricopeptide (TPR) repeat protein